MRLSYPVRKNYLQQMKIFFKLVLGASLLFFSGCGARKPALENEINEVYMEKEIEFKTVEKDYYGGLSREKKIIIKDPSSWEELWGRLYEGRVPSPPLPRVNLKKEVIAAIFMGKKPTGGYRALIKNIYFSEKSLKIYYRFISPPPGSILTQAFTSPFHIVSFRVPGEFGEVKFKKIDD